MYPKDGISKVAQGLIRHLSDKMQAGNLALFVGAGISVDPPACLPTAWQLMEQFVHLLTEEQRIRIEIMTKLRMIRLERFLSILPPDASDHALDILDGVIPNQNHRLLAQALSCGCVVMTTNFDRLIEIAAGNAINCIYSHFSHFDALTKHGYAGSLIKLHGSLDRIVSGTHSVFSTLDDILQGFSVESDKILRAILAQYPILVLGYSGADDFDIYPRLLKYNCRALYWLRHADTPIDIVSINTWPNDYATRIVQAQNGLPLQGNTREFMAALFGTTPREGRVECRKYARRLDITTQHVALGATAESLGMTSVALSAYGRALKLFNIDLAAEARNEPYSTQWLQQLEADMNPGANETYRPEYFAICGAAKLYRIKEDYKKAWLLLQAGLRRIKDDPPGRRNHTWAGEILIECARLTYQDGTEHLTPYGPSYFFDLAMRVCKASIRREVTQVRIQALLEYAEMTLGVPNYEKAMALLQESASLSIQNRDYLWAWRTQSDMALLQLRTGQYKSAIKIFTASLEFFTQCTATSEVALLRANIGFCQAHLGHYKQAIATLEQAAQDILLLQVVPLGHLEAVYKRLAILCWNHAKDREKALHYVAKTFEANAHYMPDGIPRGVLTKTAWALQAKKEIEEGHDITTSDNETLKKYLSCYLSNETPCDPDNEGSAGTQPNSHKSPISKNNRSIH